jgi:uncharacterized protein (DUF1800 family)
LATARDDVAHLLRRAGFGGTAAEIDALTPLDLPAVVDKVMDISAAPEVVPPAELADTTKQWWEIWVQVHNWWLERMRTTSSPLQEKMTLFWHGHFVSSVEKVTNFPVMFEQNQLFRSMGLGSFRALAQAVAVNPAMLVYLDNYVNNVGKPNENFARELMELFTLGVNNYTQDDIVASAKAWTGHGLNSARTAYVFTPSKHDKTNKTFFGTTKNWDGPDVINEICTGAKKGISARYIASKLWSYFAYPNPEPQLVEDLAGIFLTSADLDIRTLVRAIFLRPEFYSAKAKTGLVRTPVEFVVAAMRYTGVSSTIAHPEWYVGSMGQQVFYPPNVAGWPQNSYWINSSTIGARANFARNLTWRAKEAGVLAGTSKMNAGSAVQFAFDTFGITAPAAATRADLERWLVAERSARTGAEQQNLLTLTMLTPDFQLA